ncbi:hypothetical protein CC1G_05507 [Coprinopsis cinerea okayama7|uniref:G-alpha-domain-containing protein n=1 Tax=Coprinopsis cinerea (strain Okayama-7 / 130 / ATCC MYA-4618 / FGSC 9003) TaxID=240176 RepID=A8P5I9_COPC7|nr:hypothetical protein CC1G_05507 [Coprinopsis cinerea okayama7\|eukprot:XP_001838954.2 hypothetical protein CC1G_05507 [Coprinopsis cinerea okayama7\
MPVPAGRRPTDDPLDEVLKPPPDETPEQRLIRLEREAEAKRISLAIDASIKAERQARRKKRIVRLLLLGQSESGKSTTLRQFQRLYTPTAFREERILWRAVIQLNIVRSIRIILEALDSPLSPSSSPFSSPRSRARSISRPPPLPTQHPPLPNSDYHYANGNASGPYSPIDQAGPSNYGNGYNSDGDVFSTSPPRGGWHGSSRQRHQNFSYAQSSTSTRRHRRAPSGSNPESEVDSDTDFGYHGSPRSVHNSSITLAASHLEPLKQKLQPLKHIEQLLIAKLVPPTEEEPTQLAPPGNHSMPHIQQSIQHGDHSPYRNQEIFIRPGPGWKGALSRARVNYPGWNDESNANGTWSNGRPTSAGNTGLETQDEPQEVLHALRRDMVQLWQDPFVKEILRRKKIKLEEGSGFFLDDLERVTSMKYMPSDDDVLKARLKTVGVSEYRFEMEVSAGRDSGTEWRIVDVGGSRTTWVPFFDDVDAIIFLAPISAFDQVLTEDKSVNRLEDSVLLWKAVCSNKLLANVDLVLFLNKCDILEKKLKDGVRLAKYVRSYGDRENTLDSVSKYLRSKFCAIHREYSPNPRKFYAFCTSVTDTATTAGIIASVRDMVIRQHLKQSKLL